MSSVPLAALAIRPPESPLQQYSQLSSLSELPIRRQILQQQAQMGQLQLQDQQAMTAAMRQWDGKSMDDLPNLVLKNNGSANAVLGLKTQLVKYNTDLQALTKDQLANEATKNDMIAGHIDNVKSLPQEQQPVAFEAAKQDLLQKGYLDPQHAQQLQYPGPEGLDNLEKFYTAHSAQTKQALEASQTEEAKQKGLQAKAQTALDNIKVNLSQNSKPGDFDAQIDQMVPRNGPNGALNLRTKSLVNFALGKGDYEQAMKAIDAASAQLGAIEKETNPAVIGAKVSEAVATEVAKQKALAPQLGQITSTTRAGRQYINREDLPKESAGIVEQQAAQAGIPVVDKDVAGTLSEIDTAKANQDYMLNSVGKKLAADPSGRLFSAPENTIEKLAQTDPELAAMGTFRNAAIQSMRAVAGSKGLRINQYEVQLAIDNDIPKMTDTLPVAQQKLKNLQAFLENSESSHLTRNRAVPNTTATQEVQHKPGGKASGLKEGDTGTGSDGKKYVVKGGVWVEQ